MTTLTSAILIILNLFCLPLVFGMAVLTTKANRTFSDEHDICLLSLTCSVFMIYSLILSIIFVYWLAIITSIATLALYSITAIVSYNNCKKLINKKK
jgi:hypothetical protein